MKFKYILLSSLFASFIACDVDNELPEITDGTAEVTTIELQTDGLDFSNYIAIGASFTSGFTDNALFIEAQENSFPNILAQKFALTSTGSSEFIQPLMNDNIGGLLFNGDLDADGGFRPRLYFNGEGPAVLAANPTTEVTTKLTGSFNNYGVPGAKIYHLVAPGYGNTTGALFGLANPYFARFSSSDTTTMLTDVVSAQPTFFTMIDAGGNDVLGYALAGGGVLNEEQAVNQTGNIDVSSYGTWDITDPNVFANAFSSVVDKLTANGAKGVIGNVPNVSSLSHFTTVPYNPLDATELNDDETDLSDTAKELIAQIPTLNTVYGALNQVFTAVGATERIVEFSTEQANPVVVFDENLENLSETITFALSNDPNFPLFVQQFGLPAEASGLVAGLLGTMYGQSRPATENDLFILTSRNVIGELNETTYTDLIGKGLSETLAAQFSVNGVTKPLADNWVLTPEEQETIQIATDAYNTTIAAVAASNENVALIDLNTLLAEAEQSGLAFDDYMLSTDFVTGGLISLDGVHLTSRGYALLANKILEVIDSEFDSNFTEATNGLAKADDYPVNYSPFLQ